MTKAATIAGRYVLERRLDRGGRSEVWLSRDRLGGGSVAVKLAAGSFPDWPVHPNLVRIIDRGTAGGRDYVVMPLIEGVSLADVLANGGPPEPNEARRIIAAVTSALDALHAAGLRHGDVRAANVMIGADGTVTVIDADDPLAIGARDDGAALADLAARLGLAPALRRPYPGDARGPA